MRTLVVLALAALSSVAPAQSVPVTLSEWKLKLAHDTLPAGRITFQIKNEGTMTHGFFVRGNGVEEGSREIPAGQSGSLTLTLKPGTYNIYCPLANLSHRKAGMTAKLEVTASDAPGAMWMILSATALDEDALGSIVVPRGRE